LIGEEIYDEFDTEGAHHGEVTSYVPPQSISEVLDAAPSITRNGSAPQLSILSETSRAAVLPPAQPTQRSASATGIGSPVQRPIAIPALKGLSFLTGRSRSEPPTPRAGKPASFARPTVPEAEDEKQKASAPTNSHHIDEKPLETVIVPPVDVPAMPAQVYLPLPVAAPTVPVIMPGGPIDDAARVRQGTSAISRSASPGPSLSEALLRARRPGTPHASGTTPPKGTRFRFKSTPFGVADHVLRLGEPQQQQQQTQIQTTEDIKEENVRVSANQSDGGRNGSGVQGEE
jgi:metal transporter CNNM